MKISIRGAVKTALAVYGGYKLLEPTIERAGKVLEGYFEDRVLPDLKRKLSAKIQYLIFGDIPERASVKRPKVSYAKYVKCDRPSEDRAQTDYSQYAMKRRADILYSSRKEAEDVRDELEKLASDYGIVTLNDVRKLSGLETKYADSNWGWEDCDPYEWDICPSYIDRSSFIIDFPPIERLN